MCLCQCGVYLSRIHWNMDNWAPVSGKLVGKFKIDESFGFLDFKLFFALLKRR